MRWEQRKINTNSFKNVVFQFNCCFFLNTAAIVEPPLRQEKRTILSSIKQTEKNALRLFYVFGMHICSELFFFLFRAFEDSFSSSIQCPVGRTLHIKSILFSAFIHAMHVFSLSHVCVCVCAKYTQLTFNNNA